MNTHDIFEIFIGVLCKCSTFIFQLKSPLTMKSGKLTFPTIIRTKKRKYRLRLQKYVKIAPKARDHDLQGCRPAPATRSHIFLLYSAEMSCEEEVWNMNMSESINIPCQNLGSTRDHWLFIEGSSEIEANAQFTWHQVQLL